MEFDFVGGMSKNRSYAIDGQDCVNWYTEYYAQTSYDSIYTKHQGAKSSKALLPTPGLKLFATSSTSVTRGQYTTSTGRMFAVIGNKLSEFNAIGKETVRGTLLTSKSRVSFADNGDGAGRGYGMILVDGTYGYMYNLTTNVFQRITDESFTACTHVVFIDGYFIVNEAQSTKAWFSNPYNGLDWGDQIADSTSTDTLQIETGYKTLTIDTGMSLDDLSDTNVLIRGDYGWMSGPISSYDPITGNLQVYVSSSYGVNEYGNWVVLFYDKGSTKFLTAEGSPDYLVALASIHNELWLFGDISTEIFYDNGSAPADFERIHGAFLNTGTAARYSVATNGSQIFWLGASDSGHGQVWMATGYQPVKISNNSIDHMIEGLSKIDDATGMCYTQEGHEFYLLVFPAANKTYCYDTSTQDWHERCYYNQATGNFERHRANSLCYAFGKNLVGDYTNGNIYELSLDAYTDNGALIRRVRTGPHIHHDRARLSFNEFEIDIERGTGLSGGISRPVMDTKKNMGSGVAFNDAPDWPLNEWISRGFGFPSSQFPGFAFYTADGVDTADGALATAKGSAIAIGDSFILTGADPFGFATGVAYLSPVETQVDSPAVQGSKAQAFLQWSDDGGRTWSNEYWGTLGKIGEYKTRLHWHRLGLSRDRVFRLTISDPVKVVLIAARGDIVSRERRQ